jgi:uncharacterized protein YbjT (DUF2867 family)
MSGKNALVLGGTGETGKRVVKELCKSDLIAKVIMVTRRTIDLEDGMTGKEKVHLFPQFFL